MSKASRLVTARARKAGLAAKGKTIADLADAAGVTYSMAEKWANVRRGSEKCARAWSRLTGATG